MSFKTSLVDIDKITSKVERSTFSEKELEKLARSILELNGVVSPLVVQETSLEKYEVVEGDFQFYGALKAWEINDNFEMIRAFIVNDQEKKILTQQLKFLQKSSSENQQKNQINNLEKKLQQLIKKSEQNLSKQVTEVNIKMNKLEKKLPVKLDVLTAFNELPTINLICPLEIAGFSPTEIDKIISFIQKERKKKAFNSLAELIERSKINQGKTTVRLITEVKLIKIIDRWSKISFHL